ncbi:hypothetical protein [Marinobacter adhaerens]|uniref:hypothetical protein n=1 Tax=Marinobacter adhaerens TaxID=1033846 RepID=UPI0035CFC8E1
MEVIDSKERPAAGKDIRPAIQLIDEKGEEVELPRWRYCDLSSCRRTLVVTMANGAQDRTG